MHQNLKIDFKAPYRRFLSFPSMYTKNIMDATQRASERQIDGICGTHYVAGDFLGVFRLLDTLIRGPSTGWPVRLYRYLNGTP